MLIKACFSCTFHKIKADEGQRSYCQKEYCWAEYSDCMTIMALKHFLREQGVSLSSSDVQANQPNQSLSYNT
ncbi:MAG: hypothetical protein FJ240_06725 [Nitrospira sp.]|nr:hypothetical protein [Nitrospira sp.]